MIFSQSTHCRICNKDLKRKFKKTILRKYEIDYFQCEACNFIQTEEPYWLEEAYSDSISASDIGLLSRNYLISKKLKRILINHFTISEQKFLDWGGGFGVLVRLMRDDGFDFYRYDKHTQNIFAKGFDLSDISKNVLAFETVVAFEVLEHLGSNLMQELEVIFGMSKNLIFSTNLLPNSIDQVQNWWYLGTDTGQHVSFYSLQSLSVIARHFNKNLYSNGKDFHILSDQVLHNPFHLSFREKIVDKVTKLLEPRTRIKDGLKSDYEDLLS